MRHFMEEKGVCFMFETQMIDYSSKAQGYQVKVKKDQQIQTIDTDVLVLAIGHSARDTYELLYQKGLSMEAKAFAIGLRIEQSQEKSIRYNTRKVLIHHI